MDGDARGVTCDVCRDLLRRARVCQGVRGKRGRGSEVRTETHVECARIRRRAAIVCRGLAPRRMLPWWRCV